jgi:hypothetical protein
MKTSATVNWAVVLGTALSFILATPSWAAEAEGTGPATDKWLSSVKGRLWVCSLYARAALAHLDARHDAEAQSALEELLSKIKESKDSFSESYVAIRARLAGNKEATEALNDYASSVLVAYDVSALRTGDTPATYDRRAAELETELSTKAELFRHRLPQPRALAVPKPLAPVSAQVPVPAFVQPPAPVPVQPPAPASAPASAPVSAQAPAAVVQSPAPAVSVQPSVPVAAQPLAQASAPSSAPIPTAAVPAQPSAPRAPAKAAE